MKPNLLILLADQHRVSATGYGGNPEVRTPALDRMAGTGVSVAQCVSTHPLCAPYRACLQTGQPGSVNGVWGNQDTIRRDLPTLPQLFRDQGYSTAYFGKCHWHEPMNGSIYTPPDWRLGWEHWKGWQNGHEDYDLPEFDADGVRLHPHRGRFAPEVQVEQFLDWHASAEGPWLAQLNWGPPHNPSISTEDLDRLREPSMQINEALGLGLQEQHFETPWWYVQSFPQHLVTDVVPQRYLDMFDPEALSAPDNVHADNNRLIQYQLREYYAQIAALDDLNSRILNELERRGELDNTLVIYTSDHGDWVGSCRQPDQNCRGKGNPQEESIRVPFLAMGPGVAQGRSLDMPLSTVDLLPTFCGLVGFDAGPGFPGEDLSPVLRGEREVPERTVALEMRGWRASFDGKTVQLES
ncbi:sulfatase-like hydrolase/transferase [Coraliomargarita sp. SDUM461003]|uniref:Sulfatase-like hydrolase/transferase n=1 Tax=Thalassobacterium maritimum TaxID=3041265 RepID=A0ABU1AT33_9BACT|nr:sulfatase-like hydrolase/transferase [Coraliomargarita sp. SDUM461003]MDQ8207314.1 sulfatase-like hydrolase/transferase [Coraliomargarita sp. SDUM461003]